jgi:hypothetical protein
MSEDVEFPFNGDIPPAIPEGEHYEVLFCRAEQKSYRGRQKVYLWFRLITPGEFHGLEFYMPCNVAPNGKVDRLI